MVRGRKPVQPPNRQERNQNGNIYRVTRITDFYDYDRRHRGKIAAWPTATACPPARTHSGVRACAYKDAPNTGTTGLVLPDADGDADTASDAIDVMEELLSSFPESLDLRERNLVSPLPSTLPPYRLNNLDWVLLMQGNCRYGHHKKIGFLVENREV